MPKRKQFSASQKAQISLEILKEEKTDSQIASENGVHPNVLYRWKKQALENLLKLFERPRQAIDYRTPALAYVSSPEMLY